MLFTSRTKARTLICSIPRALVLLSLMITIADSTIFAANASSATPESGAEPAALGSMDEQYAWVGDLGD